MLALIALQGPAKAECRFGDQLTLLHFNDLHGQLAPISGAVDGQAGGIARIARRVADVRAEDPDRPVLLLFAGDLLQGTLTSSLFMGQPDVLLLERMGLDAAALGNHEFDDGQDNFRRLAELASFPFLSANVQARPRPLPVQSHLMLGGDAEPAIAVLGLTTAELLTTTHPRNTQGLRAESPVAVASALVPRLRAHADLVVVLSHLGLAADRRLAREVAGIDVIVGGHDHKALRAPVVESGVSILQAGARGQWLGRMDLGCVQGRLQPSRYQLIPVVASLPEDPEIAAEVDCIVAQAEAGMGEVIGRVDVDLSAAREGIRRGEAIFGDFVADLARDITAADVALFNGGGFRASIPRGEVTLKQVYEALPFGNQLVVGELAGAQIVAALERSAGLDPAEEPGGFLQVSGLRYAIADGRLLSARFDAAGRGTQAIDPSRRYRVVMPDYLAAGGDGYAMLAQHGEQVMTGRLVAEVVIAAIRSGAQPPSGLDGRILRH
ncbi:multifunctional 2',3'-cyclic-nucleotide 2'-phosphodiesterase/5'-nucleotidase/3'-nucleotidase [Thiocystis violacea]|nr:multifunctional 2',3'-cyclic-nucleotide 2'-phosphodiesterase/5'-nucleotidase/3'-nucleotidase [Thiocystis violacea]